MMIMRTMHEPLDLDLLRVFDHLHRERHLTRAALRAGLSQPAMSRALGRLRRVFGDPLFVRTARGMTPTPRAEELAGGVKALLERATALVRPPEFDPQTLERTFVVASSDFVDAVLLPSIAARLEERAPGVTVVTRPIAADTPEMLADGRIDLVVGVPASVPPDCMTTHLFDERFVCVVRQDHPAVRRALTLAHFVALRHVLIAPRGEPGGIVDRALERLGLTRQVVMRTHSFLSSPLVAAGSDLVLTGPSRVLLPMAKPFGLRVLRPPIDLPGFAVQQGWHPRVQHDPAHAWFREVVRGAVRRNVRG